MRISDSSITQIRAFRSDDVGEADSVASGTAKITPFDAHGQFRNALTSRGGVYFDGSGNCVEALTLQNIGGASRSYNYVFTVPSATPGSFWYLAGLTASATSVGNGNDATIGIDTSGRLDVSLRNQGSSGCHFYLNNFVTAYAGKRVSVCVVVDFSAGTVTIYVNGVSQAVTISDYSGTGSVAVVQSAATYNYHVIGGFSGNYFTGSVYSATLYNLALAQSDVTEIFELNGAVPYRFQFGSVAEKIADTTRNAQFAGATTDWGSASGGTATLDTTNQVLNCTSNGGGATGVQLPGTYINGGNFALGKAYSVGLAITNLSGGTVRVQRFGGDNRDMFFSSTTNGSFSGICTITTSSFLSVVNATASQTWSIDNVSIKQVGAISHFKCDDGVGRRIRDWSINRLHATLSASGAGHLQDAHDGVYTQQALTANGEFLDAGGIIPTDAVLVDVVVKNTTGNAVSGFALGSTSGGSDLTYATNIPANSVVILPIQRSDLIGLTVGTSPYGRMYYSATAWNSGSLNISIRYRRERDL